MGSFYETWERDVHHEVKCGECHIPPGAKSLFAAKINGLGQVVDDWLNRTSMKPSASVGELACMRSGCHDRGDLDNGGPSERIFLFEHASHLDLEYLGITIKCATCHSHIRGDNHFQVNTNACIVCHLGAPDHHPDYTTPGSLGSNGHSAPAARPQAFDTESTDGAAPASCQTCHIPPSEAFEYEGMLVDHAQFVEYGASCNSCHYGITATPSPIIDDQCLRCHVFGIDEWTDTEDLHHLHSMGEHKVECFECHGVIRHGTHTQQMQIEQFDCRNCHSDQHRIQRSTYLRDLTTKVANGETPEISPMFLSHVGCPACHIEPRPVSLKPGTGSTVAYAVPEACDRCHEDGFGVKMIETWQTSTHEMHKTVERILESIEFTEEELDEETVALMADARRLLKLVRLDGSWGVHNPKFTQRLIEQARAKVVEAQALIRDAEKDALR